MPVMEVSVVPLGTGSPSVSGYIADAVRVLRERGVRHEVTAMGTIIEADRVEELLEAALELHRAVLAKGAVRVLTSIRIDDRTDKKLTMAGKVGSVRKKLARGGSRR